MAQNVDLAAPPCPGAPSASGAPLAPDAASGALAAPVVSLGAPPASGSPPVAIPAPGATLAPTRENVDPYTRITQIMGEILQQERIMQVVEEIAPRAEDRIKRLLKLYRSSLNGDWELVRTIYDNSLENVGVEISKYGDTALHIAAAANRIDFVKELVKKINQDDRAKQIHLGSTSLFFAATSRNVELAREIVRNDNIIAQVADNHGTLPIGMAASLGHKEMVDYLYPQTVNSLTVEHRKKLFITCIETDLYDVALQLLKNYQDIAIARSADTNETALHILARKHLRFPGAKDVKNKIS